MLKLHMRAWKAHSLTAIDFPHKRSDVQGASQDKPSSQSVGKDALFLLLVLVSIEFTPSLD